MNATIIDQDLLSAAWWGYAAIAICEIKNRVCNELCPDSTPMFYMMNKKTDNIKSLNIGFGQPVVSARLGNKTNAYGKTRNEFGIVVSVPNMHNGTYLTYLPEHGHFYVAPRYNIKPILLGPESVFSIQDGQNLITVPENGTWHLRNQGETKDIIQKYKDLIESVNLSMTSEEIDVLIPSSKINSSIEAQKVILKQASEEKLNTKSPDIMWDNHTFGKEVMDNDEEIEGDPMEATPIRRSTRAGRGQHSELMSLGAKIIMNTKIPDQSELQQIMAERTEQSIREYQRRNPTEKQALNGPDKEKWLAAIKKEEDSIDNRGTVEFLPRGWEDVPEGSDVMPIVKN